MFEKAQNEKSKVTYDFTNLWSTQFFGFYHFKNFLEFASDKSVQIDYLKSRDVIWGNENGEGHLYDMKISDLEFYYEAIENLLTVLATALKKVDIYVKDEGQILNGEHQ